MLRNESPQRRLCVAPGKVSGCLGPRPTVLTTGLGLMTLSQEDIGIKSSYL